MRKKNKKWKSIDWRYLYFSIAEENKKLKKQIEVLESIVRVQLPIIESNIIKNKKDK
jgi:anaerobic selenocysteine-containing dehydrogenase